MAHKFPKNHFTIDWPIDAEEINDNLRTVAEEIECRINEHNVRAGTFNDRTDCATGAILNVNNSFTEVNVSMNFADGSVANTYPGAMFPPANQTTVSASGEWQAIITSTKFTANSLLWIINSFQQQLYDGATNSEIDQFGTQYAIRLDGAIIEETTIGGLDRPNDNRGEAIKQQAAGFVTDAVIPVAPGQHTIELVARVIRDTIFTQPPATEYNTVGNRELIILTLDPDQGAVAGNGVVWSPLQEGDSIAVVVINTPFTAITNEMNALDYTAVQPESLHAEHLTGVVLLNDYMTIGAAATHTYTNKYPGWDSDTVGAPGWAVVTQGSALSFTFAGQDLSSGAIAGCLVMVDINIISIDDTTQATDDFLAYGLFVIQVQSGGTWRTVAKTERYTNGLLNQNPTPLSPMTNCRRNMPIRTFIRSTDLDGGTTMTGVRVMVSGYTRENAANNIEVVLQQCNFSYAFLRATT